METVAESLEQDEQELRLLTEWTLEGESERRRRAAVLSIATHVTVILVLAALPKTVLTPASAPRRLVTPLIAPPELTQPTPNKGKITKEFDAESRVRPSIQLPRGALSTTRPAAQAPGPPAPPALPPKPEPPKVETATNREPPQITPPAPPEQNPPLSKQPTSPAPPPQIQTEEKPKLAFETPGAQPPVQSRGVGRLAAPSASVDEALRSMASSRGPSGGLMVGDAGADIGGIGEGVNLPPSPGKAGSNLELLSDPMGVDFRPYLIRILQSVKRNWFAIMPESAKLGRRGRTVLQFSIDRQGRVPKLVIVDASGTEALDRAAVAGVSASNPFPPLPSEFRGNQIRLQFTFSYNMPAR